MIDTELLNKLSNPQPDVEKVAALKLANLPSNLLSRTGYGAAIGAGLGGLYTGAKHLYNSYNNQETPEASDYLKNMAIGAGTGGLIGGLSSVIGNYNASRQAAQAAAEKAKRMEDVHNWVDQKLDEHKKDVLSYYINKNSIKKDVPYDLMDKLKEQYGNEVVYPIIGIGPGAFFGKFHGDISEYDDALRQWCIKNNLGTHNGKPGEVTWGNIISTNQLAQEQEAIANKIIDEALRGYGVK